jgi:hypothetical protein
MNAIFLVKRVFAERGVEATAVWRARRRLFETVSLLLCL